MNLKVKQQKCLSSATINQPNEIPLEGHTGKGYEMILYFLWSIIVC